VDHLIKFINAHNLEASPSGDSILTFNEYMDRDRVFHREPVLIQATAKAVREFLGY